MAKKRLAPHEEDGENVGMAMESPDRDQSLTAAGGFQVLFPLHQVHFSTHPPIHPFPQPQFSFLPTEGLDFGSPNSPHFPSSASYLVCWGFVRLLEFQRPGSKGFFLWREAWYMFHTMS